MGIDVNWNLRVFMIFGLDEYFMGNVVVENSGWVVWL